MRTTLINWVITLLIAGCGDGRSTEKFCSVLQQGSTEIEARFKRTLATDSSLMGLENMAMSLSRSNTLIHELALVAPEEIRGDMENVLAYWEEQTDRASGVLSDPVGVFFGMTFQHFVNLESQVRVVEFASLNCGVFSY